MAQSNWAINVNNTGFTPMPAGGVVEYTVRIDNAGNIATPATEVTFTIPEPSIYVGITGLENCAPAPETVPSPTTAPVDVVCDVPVIQPAGNIGAVVSLRHMEQGAATLFSQIQGGPNFSRTTTVQRGADLGVALSADPSPVQAGDMVTLSAAVTNYGPDESTEGQLILDVPVGLSRNVQFPPSSSCSINDRRITCDLADLAVDETADFDFTTQVTAANASTATAEAQVDGSTPRDPISDNDIMTAAIDIQEGSDLGLTKSRSPSGVLVEGQQVTFTLQPTLAGAVPSAAQITDTVPENYDIADVIAGEGWTCEANGQVIECNYLDGVDADFLNPIMIETTAATNTGGGVVTNVAEISSDGENEGAEDNNSADDGGAQIDVPRIDLVADKEGPPRGLVTVGNDYEFTLRARNNGNLPFSEPVSIIDVPSAGLAITAVDAPDDWTCVSSTSGSSPSDTDPIVNPDTLVCTTEKYETAPLGIGQWTDTITVTALVTEEGDLDNQMEVEFESEDADPTNNTADAGDLTSANEGNWADVYVTKTVVGDDTVVSGDEITFRIEIVNAGDAVAEDVRLVDQLTEIVGENGGEPGNITPQISLGNVEELTCDPLTGSGYSRTLNCTIATLPVCTPNDDCPTVEITVRPGDEGSKQNTASAYSFATPDDDTENNISTEDYTVTPRTDVTVTKTSTSEAVGAAVGQSLTYVITAEVPDLGLSAARNVTITDTLPAGVRFLEAIPSAGSCGPGGPASGAIITTGVNDVLECNLGTIGNLGQQTVTITVVPTMDVFDADTPMAILNSVSVSTSTPEIDETNNSDDVSIEILPPEIDLEIQKVDGPDPVEIDTDTTYSITVINSGPSDATRIFVVDDLPESGLANPRVSSVPEGWDCDIEITDTSTPDSTVTCWADLLMAGSEVDIEIDMEAVARGRHTNTATVRSAETVAGYDTVEGNNVSNEDTTVRVKSDLMVTKSSSVSQIDLRDEFSWDIAVTAQQGDGLDVAEAVVLTDDFPEGMVLTQVPEILQPSETRSCTGGVNDTGIVCQLDEIGAGETVTVRIWVKVIAVDEPGDAVVNEVSVTTQSFEQNEDDNTAEGSVNTVQASSISGTIYRDFNADDILTGGQDTGIANVTVNVSGTALHDGETITASAQTDGNGDYTVSNIPPGTYTVSYDPGSISEDHLVEGSALPGTDSTANDPAGTIDDETTISEVVITTDVAGTDYDFTRIPTARIGLGKVATAAQFEEDGSYTITYTLTAENFSLEPVDNVVIEDDLDGPDRNFGTYTGDAGTPPEGSYTVTAVTGGAFGTLNTDFGGDAQQTLVSDGTLGVGESGTVSYTVHVNPAVPRTEGLSHTNQATISAQGRYSGQDSSSNDQLSDISNNTANPDPDNNGIGNETGNNTPTVVSPDFAPSISLDKTADFEPAGEVADVGDTITYTFVVTNTGNTPLIDVTVTDDLPGLSALDGPTQPLRLEPGEDATFTATYDLEQTDLNNDAVANTASAQGQWGENAGGEALTVSDTDEAEIDGLADPGLMIEKSVQSTTVSDPSSLGETITYQFTVTNTGNTDLTDVVVVDPLLGEISELDIGEMPRGGAAEVVAAPYAIDQDDIDAGRVDNEAYATGDYAAGTVESEPDDATQPVYQQPLVEISKDIDTDSLPEIPSAGDILTWTVTATNTGNVTLTDLVLTDPIAGAEISPASHPSVAPDGEVIFTVQAPITQEHINAGDVTNTASVSSEEGATDSDDETVALTQSPGIALTKQMITDLSVPREPGETLRYRFTITNTGNVPLDTLTLTDGLAGFVLDEGDETALADAVLQPQNAGDTIPEADTTIVVEGLFTLDQNDINAGEVVNTADVEAYPTVGSTDEPVTDTDQVETSLDRNPQIRLIKTITSQPEGVARVGDEVTYAFEIRNVGNVVLGEITLTETLEGAEISPSSWSGTLSPGERVDDVFTATYALTQDDINAGIVENQATVSGRGIGESGELVTVTDASGTAVDNDTATEVELETETGLEIVKSEETSLQTPPQAGDTIDYSFVVTNTGNITLYDVAITDPMISDDPLTTIDELQPGEGNAVTHGPVTYTIDQDDVQSGEVRNTATADGFTDAGNETPISSDSNEIVVELEQVPGLAIVKRQESDLGDPTEVGEEIDYYFDITNTGNIIIDDIEIVDEMLWTTPYAPDDRTLLPGEDLTVGPFTYALDADDIEREFVENQATVSATYDVGDGEQSIEDLSGPTNDTDEPLIVPTIPVAPELAIVKEAEFVGGGSSYTLVGDRIDFTFTVSNTGNVPVEDVSPEEISFAFDGTPAETEITEFDPPSATIARGESQVFTASYVLTQNDLNAGAGVTDGVVNTARATGTAIGLNDAESPVSSPEDSVVLTLSPQPPSDVVITKTTSRPMIHRGETIPFEIEVRNNSLSNAGDVTIVDRIPSGFVLVDGSASVDGVAFEPEIAGNEITFPDLPLGAEQRIEIGLVLRALPGTPPGRYRNLALGYDELGTPLGPQSVAEFEIVPDAVFDCSDIIGTVFDDRDGNGYQDEGEPGIPGVRLSTVRGTLVTTDAFGRFSIPCAAIPNANIGSNFVLKLDGGTLPTGFTLTTDNPAMVRVTPGKMVEVNFGVQVGRQIKIAVSDPAFDANATTPGAELEAGLGQLIALLAEQEAHLHVEYEAAGDQAMARSRMDRLVRAIRQRWAEAGAPYELVIDTTIGGR